MVCRRSLEISASEALGQTQLPRAPDSHEVIKYRNGQRCLFHVSASTARKSIPAIHVRANEIFRVLSRFISADQLRSGPEHFPPSERMWWPDNCDCASNATILSTKDENWIFRAFGARIIESSSSPCRMLAVMRAPTAFGSGPRRSAPIRSEKLDRAERRAESDGDPEPNQA